MLPQTDAHEAYVVAERMRSRMREAFAEERRPALTMSFGIAAYPTHGASVEPLLRAADEALYAAKRLGRDRTVLYSLEIEGFLSEDATASSPHDHARLATVLGLAEALDLRDSGTARHSQTVGRYCQLMARALDLPAEHVERVRLAGVLHDIGKIAVPDSILRKPGELSEDEYAQMRKHPEIGARILGGSDLADIRDWILAHHERPDGKGYPHGLTDGQIPLEAKILAVGDAYEAMTSDRVYRRSIGTARGAGRAAPLVGQAVRPARGRGLPRCARPRQRRLDRPEPDPRGVVAAATPAGEPAPTAARGLISVWVLRRNHREETA